MSGRTLKAALVDSQGHLKLADIEKPRIGRGELLVKMKVCGICGTDLEKLHGVGVTPPILGHEVAGEIDQVGEKVKGYSRGDRIIVHHHVACETCFYCRHGNETLCQEFPRSNLDPCGFAEYFRVPELNVAKGAVFRVPDNMSYEEAAFAEPTGCCIRGLDRLAVGKEDSVLVIGAGPIGLTYMQLLRTHTAHSIIALDLIESRLRWAREFGANRVLNASDKDLRTQVFDATNNRGADSVIVASGSLGAMQSALALVRKGGKVLLFGIPEQGSMFEFDASSLFIREIKLIPSYSTTESEIGRALQMMEKRLLRLNGMITHRFSLGDIVKAFQVADDAQSSLKVMIHE